MAIDFTVWAFVPGGLHDRLLESMRQSRGELGDAGAARYARQLVRHLRANGAFTDYQTEQYDIACTDARRI